MIIIPTEKIDVEIIPEILQMPMYCLEQNGYIPLAFFTELGASEEDIKTIIGKDNFKNSNTFEIQIDQQKFVSAISHNLATSLITQLAVMYQYSIFASISKKLIIKSFESGAVTVDDFADDFRQDSVFWHSKISSLLTQINSSKPNFSITPHPQVDFATISRLDDEELDAYLELNPAYISYKITQFLCNCQLPLTHNVWRDYLLKYLDFHRRDLEYEYFLYHLLIQDENVCLLTQTLLTDWMLEDGFSLYIPNNIADNLVDE
jgi:hypothetical protein